MRKATYAAVVLLGFLVACDRGHEYPAELVENFIASCRTKAPEHACRCAIDRVRISFTADEFRAFEERIRAGEVPPELANAVTECGRR